MTRANSSVGFGHSQHGARRSWRRTIPVLLLIGVLGQPLIPASADELDDQQSSLRGDIAQSGEAIAGFSAQLDAATAEVVASREALADAQVTLAKATSERDAAAAEDALRASELAAAEDALSAAKAAVADGTVAVEEQKAKAVADLRTSNQQNTALLSIGMLFMDNQDAGDVSSRIQWASTVYNANAAEMNRLTQMQLQLQSDQTTMATLEDQARVAREAAAAHLAITQAAERAADEAAARVAELVSANEAAEARAADLLANERANYAAMQAEMDDVTRRIQERNAEAERQAAAAAAEAARQAAAAAAAAQSQSSYVAPAPAAPAPAAPAPAASSGFPLAKPANGWYSSPYGWRTNPVLGYSELHDGLDIAASCGSPLYAAADGRVSEMYYGGGWGWKLTIDNGWINGVRVSTGYNHAQGYIVSVGEWVSRGQVVGYTGTTGLSTGCHLHFHTWINGQVTNPANYL